MLKCRPNIHCKSNEQSLEIVREFQHQYPKNSKNFSIFHQTKFLKFESLFER